MTSHTGHDTGESWNLRKDRRECQAVVNKTVLRVSWEKIKGQKSISGTVFIFPKACLQFTRTIYECIFRLVLEVILRNQGKYFGNEPQCGYGLCLLGLSPSILLPVPADFPHDSSDPDQTEFFGCRCEDRWGIAGKIRRGFPNALPFLMNLK